MPIKVHLAQCNPAQYSRFNHVRWLPWCNISDGTEDMQICLNTCECRWHREERGSSSVTSDASTRYYMLLFTGDAISRAGSEGPRIALCHKTTIARTRENLKARAQELCAENTGLGSQNNELQGERYPTKERSAWKYDDSQRIHSDSRVRSDAVKTFLATSCSRSLITCMMRGFARLVDLIFDLIVT